MSTFSFFQLLSAVNGTIPLRLACGIGILIGLFLSLVPMSVLDLLYWYLMCKWVYWLNTLVGGCFDILYYCGFFSYCWLDTSDYLSISRGARLLIGIWCVWVLLVGEMLLSAVVGWTLYQVACGFGIVGIILGMLTSTSVLDYLYGIWCVKGT